MPSRSGNGMASLRGAHRFLQIGTHKHVDLLSEFLYIRSSLLLDLVFLLVIYQFYCQQYILYILVGSNQV